MLLFRIDTAPDDNGAVLITSPDLPELTTYAEAQDEIVRRALDAVEEALAARIASGLDIPAAEPEPGARIVSPSLLTRLKVELYRACREAGVSRAWLARELGWHREQVDRLFRLDHASRVDQLEAALATLGRSYDVATRAA